MKTLKIPKYNIKDEKEEKVKDAQITFNFISMGVNSKYPNGLDEEYRRSFAHIQNKFDKAIEDNEKSVNLEEAEFNLIKNSIQDGKFAAINSKLVVMLEDAIEESKSDKKK